MLEKEELEFIKKANPEFYDLVLDSRQDVKDIKQFNKICKTARTYLKLLIRQRKKNKEYYYYNEYIKKYHHDYQKKNKSELEKKRKWNERRNNLFKFVKPAKRLNNDKKQ